MQRQLINWLVVFPVRLLTVTVTLPFMVLLGTVLRGVCPCCQKRGLRGARMLGSAELHDGDKRPFQWSECDYCHHQFHRFDDGTCIHLPPSDPRYFRAS